MTKDSKTLRKEPNVWGGKKRLEDFLPLVVNLEAEGQTSRAEVVQYLISRAMIAESNLEPIKREAYEEVIEEATGELQCIDQGMIGEHLRQYLRHKFLSESPKEV